MEKGSSVTIASVLTPDSDPEGVQPLRGVASSSKALTPLDIRTTCGVHGHWREFNGRVSLCCGAVDSERLIVSAHEQRTGTFVIAALPTKRTGIAVEPDWNNIGQWRTDSGSVMFEAVPVELQAKQRTLNESRPWYAAEVAHREDDPYVLSRRGDFWLGLDATRVLADRAAELLDAARRCGPTLSADARRLTRHWRNLRTHTLHAPMSCKLRESGQWALESRQPESSFHS